MKTRSKQEVNKGWRSIKRIANHIPLRVAFISSDAPPCITRREAQGAASHIAKNAQEFMAYVRIANSTAKERLRAWRGVIEPKGRPTSAAQRRGVVRADKRRALEIKQAGTGLIAEERAHFEKNDYGGAAFGASRGVKS